MNPSGSPPTHATFRAASRIGELAADPWVERPMRALPVERHREAAKTRPETEDGCVEPRPPDGPRLDELVVAPRHEGTRPELR